MNNNYYNPNNWNNWNYWNYYAAERASLKHDANYIGIVTLVLTALLQVIFTLIMLVLHLLGIANLNQTSSYYGMGSTGFLIAYAASYCMGMGLPAPLVTLIAHRHVRPFSRYEEPNGEARQLRPFSVILALMAGMAVCILANFVSSYIMAIFNEFGVKTPEMPSYLNKSGLSLFLNVLIFAVFPAILEEMVYRGYILRTLRRYGNGFAIVVSATLFALMHGNILQIPFAFLVGLACGYLVVQTGHIWPAMLLHFLNNFMSTQLEYFSLYASSGTQIQQMTLIVFAMIGIIGLVSLLILFATGDPIVQWTPSGIRSGMTAGQKTGALLCSPAFLISVIFSVILTIVALVEGVV